MNTNLNTEITLYNRIVWITGAGRGIGRALAYTFGTDGARVVLSARNTDEISKLTDDIKNSGGRAVAIPCDVTRKEDIDSLISTITKNWGDIDVLINNAGVWVFNKITDVSEEEWDIQIDTNLKATFLCTKAVLPAMIHRRSGHIINMVSVAGEIPFSNCAAYCASKYGVLGFTEALRLDIREFGIKVTAVLPGATDTPGWNRSDADRARMMRPESVAAAVKALCKLPPEAVPEKYIIRPIGGDL